MKTPFLYPSDEPEPHRGRGKEILRRHPEVRKLIGFSYATSAVMFAVVAAQLAIAWWVQASQMSYLWVVPLAYVAGGTLNHWSGMGIHEASHNLVARTELANRLIALFANIPIVFPAAMPFRRYHLKHHSHLGIEGHDNDLSTPWEIAWVGRSRFKKAIWLLFYPFFATMARGFVNKPSGWEWANVAFSIATGVGVYVLLGGDALAYLLLSTFFGFGLVHPTAAHFIHEHYIWKEGQETYSYYGPLNWVTFHVGYHNEHHDIMSIPCWKLPALKKIAASFYEGQATHRSWAWVLWHFMMNRGIGHESRIVRDRATLLRRPKPRANTVPLREAA
jgi:sphingolipid delta-4 desaturase